MAEDEVGCNGVIMIPQKNKVCEFARGFDKAVVHGSYGVEVLLGHRFGCATAFGYIAIQAANEANIWWGINKNFEIEAISEYLFGEYKNAFNYDDGLR